MNVYSVSQINGYLKQLMENDVLLRNIYIEAEISNLKMHSSGHIYMTLKDNDAAISAVMFRTYTYNLKFEPENGMKILAGGYISIYEKTGQYQLYITDIQPAGKGALYLAYEQLKARLEKSGVFSQKYKKSIPEYPKVVAVITSPTGAAVRDIINVTNRRNPNVEIVVVPVLVQGENAAEDIVKGIELVNRWKKADTIILGRGGGSIEDLWAFNEEIVARAIFNSETPIISAVGHETDFTIADFIADLRAPTPSAAAELSVPENKTTNLKISEINKKLQYKMNDILSKYEYRYNILKENHSFKYFRDKISENQLYIDNIYNVICNSFNNKLNTNSLKIAHLCDNLENRSPINIIKRGYSLAYSKNKIIKSVDDVSNGDDIIVKVNDGDIHAKVIK